MNHRAVNPQCSVGGIVKQPQALEFICQPASYGLLDLVQNTEWKERVCKNRFKLMFLISFQIKNIRAERQTP